MDKKVGIHNMDLDIQNFITKRMDDDESILYLRTKRDGDDGCDVVWAVNGDANDIIEAFAGTEQLRAVANLVTAALISNGLLDIEKYMKDYEADIEFPSSN